MFRLGFEPALAGGEVGVRWSVRAGDAHPIEGSFAFTVAAGPTAEASTATAADEMQSTAEAGGAAGPQDDMSSMSAAEMASMDEFLAVDQSTPGESLARLGRLISFAVIVLGIGALAFAATTLRGSLEEIGSLIAAVRILGGVLVVGALVEYVGVARIGNESLGAAWTSSAGVATALRVVAGVAIAVGLVATTVPIRTRARSLSAAATSSTAELDVETRNRRSAASVTDRPVVRRWVPDRSSRLAFVGIGLAIISFWFDGHTVTKGFRVLHALANSVHVVAGSVWVGGVVTMAVVMWTRHRRSLPTDSLGLVVRFSAVASVALGAVVVAGLVMAVAILDSFGELDLDPMGPDLPAEVERSGAGDARRRLQPLPADAGARTRPRRRGVAPIGPLDGDRRGDPARVRRRGDRLARRRRLLTIADDRPGRYRSRNPLPSRILCEHFSTREARVDACFAPEKYRLYSRWRPGVSDSNADAKAGS